MASKLRNLTLNQRLALVAFGLGAIALFANPLPGPVVAVDAQEMALLVQREADHVTPQELAAWIVEGRADYRLVDLRSAKEFADYSIPGAQNVPLTDLTQPPFDRSERLLLYSQDGTHASQAWLMLRARGYRSAYTLQGGLDAWKNQVLFPTLREDASAEQRAAFEKTAELARYFGGTPRLASAAGATATELPKLSASAVAAPPPVAAAGGGAAPKRKKKEGC
jgi:rhodanese-related sulfurtransferase